MNVSEKALRLLDMLDRHGDVYLVGGCVRDYVMGQPVHDEDMATNLMPDEISAVLKQNHYPVIPVGAQFGTINTLVDSKTFEITTFRKEMGYSDGRHPDGVEYSRHLEDDAARRDFTCNAMYYSVKRDEIVDPFGGLKDIRENRLRAVGDPNDRFQEDALRMMRAVRFCAAKGFDMDDSVMGAIRENKYLIQKVSAERKFMEMTKILMSGNPEKGVRLMAESGLLQEVLPEVDALVRCDQNNVYHGETVFEHTMRALSNADGNEVVRWSVLLHDIGKVPAKTTGVDGRDHFYGHAELSERLADGVLRRLRCSNDFRKDVDFCVRMHDERFDGTKHLRTRVVRMYVDKYSQAELFERNVDNLRAVQKADVLGQKAQVDLDKRLEGVESLHTVLTDLLSKPHHMSDLQVNGNEMLDVGLQPKEIPLMKKRLLHGLLLDKLLDKESQLKFVHGNRKVVHEEFCKKNDSVRRLPDIGTVGDFEKSDVELH